MLTHLKTLLGGAVLGLLFAVPVRASNLDAANRSTPAAQARDAEPSDQPSFIAQAPVSAAAASRRTPHSSGIPRHNEPAARSVRQQTRGEGLILDNIQPPCDPDRAAIKAAAREMAEQIRMANLMAEAIRLEEEARQAARRGAVTGPAANPSSHR